MPTFTNRGVGRVKGRIESNPASWNSRGNCASHVRPTGSKRPPRRPIPTHIKNDTHILRARTPRDSLRRDSPSRVLLKEVTESGLSIDESASTGTSTGSEQDLVPHNSQSARKKHISFNTRAYDDTEDANDSRSSSESSNSGSDGNAGSDSDSGSVSDLGSSSDPESGSGTKPGAGDKQETPPTKDDLLAYLENMRRRFLNEPTTDSFADQEEEVLVVISKNK